MTDSIADMLARIKNGQTAGLSEVFVPYSNLKKNILQVIKNEGYIKSYEENIDSKTNHKGLIVRLKYDKNRKPVVQDVKRISKPGCRVYSSIGDLKGYYNNLGVVVLSTSKGIMSDSQARTAKLGGEVLFKIF
ncbi:MAG: 30S ribosomal protein S8 [Rickettsiales bacterium]|nr:30S ribosomal protein S8 [Rickettsiales bacterium]